MRAHAVVDAARVGGHFTVHLESEAVINARALLLATGVEDDVPAFEGLDSLYGRSVFHCPYCDGWELRDQPLAALDIPLRREPIVRLEGVDGRLERVILAGGASVSRRARTFP